MSGKTAPWALATIASGYYPETQGINHTWNAASAALVRDRLSAYRPALTLHLDATPGAPLSREGTLAFARDFVGQARAAGARVAVLYYIGHGETKDDILLKQGSGVPGEGDEHAPVRLQELYKELESGGLPFALLLDQCMESDEYVALARQKGFALNPRTGDLSYEGPNEVVGGELFEMAGVLRDFAVRHRYLQTENPVILSAVPGVKALAQPNPDWMLGALVGPLARRVNWTAQWVASERIPPSLGEFLKRVPENGRTGEISYRGSKTFSDFEAFIRAARNVTLDGADTGGDAPKLSLVNVPGVDRVQDFARLGDTFILVSGWRVLRWDRTGGRLEVVANEVSAGSTRAGGDMAYFDTSAHELFRVRAKGPSDMAAEPLDVGILGPGAGHNSVLAVEQDHMVDTEDTIWRLEGSSRKQVDRFKADSLFDLIEWQPGVMYFTCPDEGSLWRRAEGRSVVIADSLQSPGMMDFTDSYIYALSQTRRYLYRIGRDNELTVLDLAVDDAQGLLPHEWSARGFAALDDAHFLLAGRRGLVKVDAEHSTWRRVSR